MRFSLEALEGHHPWLAFALRRGLRLVVSLFAVGSAVFAMISLVPGDPVRAALGPNAPQELVTARKVALGLDDPLAVQFVDWWRRLFTGDLGTSIASDRRVTEVLAERMGTSAQLVGAAIVVTLLLAVTIGMAVGVATHHGRRPRLLVGFTLSGSAVNTIPSFLTGLVLVYLFAVTLRLLPVAGSTGWQSLVLPTIALSVGPAAGLSRIVRAETDRVLAMDYMQVARSKRLLPWRLYLRHALPNTLTAALTIGGLLFGVLIAGSVVIESVFARTGLGTTIVKGITDRDFPLVQGVLLVLATGVLLVNLLVDVVIGLLDRQSLIGRS